jgi:hypothetical protein
MTLATIPHTTPSLFEAGFTDEHGQLTAPYRSKDLNDD